MATTTLRKLVENVGIVSSMAKAHVVAAAADDTAGTFDVKFNNELASIEDVIVYGKDSGNVEKSGYDVTFSGTTVTIADGGTTTIANGDIFVVVAFGNPK